MDYCEQICAECPFRRDSERLSSAPDGPPPAQWYAARAGQAPQGHACAAQGGALCLGWAVHLRNRGCASVAASMGEEVYDWVWGWSRDEELIFSHNGDFIRYHQGEHFGSEEWYREDQERLWGADTKSRTDSPSDDHGEPEQLSLF